MLLSKLNDNNARKLYAQESLENAWSSSVLNHRVDMRYIEREGKGVTDFAETMPPANYDMPAQVFKYPYLFDFIGTAETMREVEVERPLVVHMVKLGQGFAFVGRQVHLAVGGDDFFIRLYYKRFFWLSKLVPQGGFEPPQAESESAVLPLHNRGMLPTK